MSALLPTWGPGLDDEHPPSRYLKPCLNRIVVCETISSNDDLGCRQLQNSEVEVRHEQTKRQEALER